MTGTKKKTILGILIGLAVVLVVVGALFAVRKLSAKAVEVFPASDVILTGYYADASETEGVVETRNMQSVYLSSTQTVTEVYVTEGQTVKAGDPLLAVDTTLTEIELERERIAVEQKKLDLEAAQKELDTINTYTPYVAPTEESEEESELPAQTLPMLLGGQGTEEHPYIYLWNDDQWYTEDFIDGILPKEEADPKDSGSGEESSQEDSGESGQENSSENRQESSGQTTYQTATVYVVFEERQYDNALGELLKNWEIQLVRNTDGSVSFHIGEPSENYADDGSSETSEDSEEDPAYVGPQYTWAEIQAMKKEAQEKLRDADLAVRVEQVKYEKLQAEMQTGTITATVDGVVKTLNDETEAKENGIPFCVVSGGGGYYIQGTLSELELSSVKIGQTVTVTSWMNDYTVMEGEIVEIGEYPAETNMNYGSGNTNSSYYPFYVFVSDDENLQDGEYVSMEYTPAEDASGIFLQSAYVRQESGKCYVYVEGSSGTLEKRAVTTGRDLWGSYTEILSGLSEDDMIAFPYGKNVKEGAPVSETDTLYGDGAYYY